MYYNKSTEAVSSLVIQVLELPTYAKRVICRMIHDDAA